MYKRSFLIIAALLSITSTSFSEDKTYLSIEERVRPLSLPPKTWKIDIGGEFAFGQTDSSFEIYSTPNLTNIEFPHLPIGNRTELHFLTPLLKFYPIKNTVVKDNAMMISGTNFAIFAGITSLGYAYSQAYGSKMYLDYGLGYQFKSLLGEKSWLFANGIGSLDLYMYWSANMTLGTGFQITDRFSIITSLDGSAYLVPFQYPDRDEDRIGYTIKLPIDFKFNKKINRGFMIRTGFTYMINTINDKRFWGVPIGLQYSWHW